MYIGKNMYNKLVLKKQLYNLRMQEGGNIVGYIQWFDQISMDLQSLRMQMEKEDKSLLLLCLLPNSFNLLVMIVLYGKETLHYKKIVSMLKSKK